MEDRKADLHMHTVASDGTDTLEERIEDAGKKGLDVIAITDHDTINEKLDRRVFTAENGVKVITGAEIKCKVQGEKIEILAYFIDPEGEEIQQLLTDLSRRREERMEKFVENLNSSHSLALDKEQVLEKAEGNIGRPHLARTLVEEDVVDSEQEAFERFIGSEQEEYVAVKKASAEKVIKAIHENGGVTSLAHPGRDLPEEEAERIVEKLKQKGLDGLEVEYTYDEKRDMNPYDIKFGEQKASRLAEKFDLVKTGGSDCHGSESGKYFIGRIKIPYSRIEELRNG